MSETNFKNMARSAAPDTSNLDFENMEEANQEISNDKATNAHVSVESQNMELVEEETGGTRSVGSLSNDSILYDLELVDGVDEVDEHMDNSFEHNLEKITRYIFSGYEHQELVACRLARNIITDDDQNIDSLIKSGIVRKFIQLLKSPNVDIQYEAVSIMVSLVYQNSSHANYIVGNGAIDPLIGLLNSPQHEYVVERAIWVLGKIASADPILRDMLITKGVISPLLALVKPGGTPQPVNLAWTLSVLFKSAPLTIEAFRQVLPPIVQLIMSDDINTLFYACKALVRLVGLIADDEPFDEKIEALLNNADALPRLYQLLNSVDENRVVAPALRIICKALSSNDHSHVDRVVESGPLISHLEKFLQSPNPILVSRAAWATGNIAALPHQISGIFAGNLIQPLLQVIHQGESYTQTTALSCILYIILLGTLEQLASLRQNPAVFQAICAMLQCKDPENVVMAMGCVDIMLQRAAEIGQLEETRVAVDECGGLGILESLQNHESPAIYTRVNRLLQQYFNNEDGIEEADNGEFQMDVQLLAPPPENGFNFE